MDLNSAFLRGGAAAVIRELMQGDVLDEEEYRLRWQTLFSALQRQHPDFPASGFVDDEANP